jgi:predicted nucleic acid-binding protein
MIFSFAQDLDKGELEVIISAKELNINNVVIEEKSKDYLLKI